MIAALTSAYAKFFINFWISGRNDYLAGRLSKFQNDNIHNMCHVEMIWHEQIVICAVKWASQLQTIPLRRISTVVEYWKKSVTSSCYLMSASRWATIPSGSWIRIFFPAIKYIILSIQIYLFISQIHNHSVYEFCLKLLFFLTVIFVIYLCG